MSCPGIVAREFEFLPDGTVIASYRTSTAAPENLYHLSKTCGTMHQYTSLSDSAASVASDFAISPDGTTLAFLGIDPAVQDAALAIALGGGYVFTAPVDGSSAPIQVTNRPALYGPRWIAGGTLLVFTRFDSEPDGGFLSTSAVVISPDASTGKAVATGDGYTTTGNGACSMAWIGSGGRAVGPGAFSLLSLAAIARFLRRKRRRA
jgi:hypothetical protein